MIKSLPIHKVLPPPTQQVQALSTKYFDQKHQHQTVIDALAPKLQQIKAAVDAKYATLDQEIPTKAYVVRLGYRSLCATGDKQVAQTVAQLQTTRSRCS